jgi:hypothetical protein
MLKYLMGSMQEPEYSYLGFPCPPPKTFRCHSSLSESTEPVFSHGQLYVALSRGVSRKDTWVLAKTNKDIDPTRKRTKNIVFKDVLEL